MAVCIGFIGKEVQVSFVQLLVLNFSIKHSKLFFVTEFTIVPSMYQPITRTPVSLHYAYVHRFRGGKNYPKQQVWK